MVSSKEIVFAPGDGLESGMIAEIALAWPFLLDDHIHLQLVLDTTILGSRNGVAEARILAYDFRTCGGADAGTYRYLRPTEGSGRRRGGRRPSCSRV